MLVPIVVTAIVTAIPPVMAAPVVIVFGLESSQRQRRARNCN
jgi:hypothetical protein